MLQSLTTNQPQLKACVVTAYAPEHVKPQRLITHAAATPSQVAVVQAGWYGEVIGDQSGPSCVMLINANAEALAASIQQLLADEAPFLKHQYVSAIEPLEEAHDGPHALWHEVAKALLKWENHQK